MAPGDYLDRLWVQSLYPNHFRPCAGCGGQRMAPCAECAGTGKVSVATVQGVQRRRNVRRAEAA